ncbi:hypothetical protein [Methanocaldococcus sp.]|nr:hypothetical protein [Methanocaldococcus sp.]
MDILKGLILKIFGTVIAIIKNDMDKKYIKVRCKKIKKIVSEEN